MALALTACQVFVKDKNHRRSPLVQWGLGIPVEVIIEMDATTRNKSILDKCKELVTANNYKEPGQYGRRLHKGCAGGDSDLDKESDDT